MCIISASAMIRKVFNKDTKRDERTISSVESS